MATNKIQTGKILDFTAPSGGVVSGSAYLIGSVFGVALTTAAEGESFALAVEEVYELPKATGVTFSEGDPLYWDVADARFNDDDDNNLCTAIAIEDAGSSATTVKAKLIGVALGKVASLTDRMGAVELEIDGLGGYTFTGAGDQVTMSDTAAKTFTKKATVPADAAAVNDWVEWEAEVFIDGAVSTPAVTVKVLWGTAELDSQAIATAAANDYVIIRGRGRITGATTLRKYAGLGETKDATLSLQTHAAPADLTIQTLSTARDITVTATSDGGNAGNLATLKALRFAVNKAA